MKFVLLFIIVFFSDYSWGNKNYKELATFSARISRINRVASLVRIKASEDNTKFLNRGDQVEFWNNTFKQQRCQSQVVGRGSEYILLKVPYFDECIHAVHITVGSHLDFYSRDLENNLKTASELMDILLKKKMAYKAKNLKAKKELDSYIEKVDATNRRYEVLRQKLEMEWKKDLASLEEDKTKAYIDYQASESEMTEIDHKIQKYHIYDNNFIEQRWSLDPKLYFKK